MTQTAIWIPPSLCGCQLRMTANFVPGSIIDGISYRHPIPFSITALDIVNVCNSHHSNTQAMTNIESLMETDKITGNSYQQRGYLKHPIESPSAAECLYEFLSRYNGQTHSYPCGCKSHQFIDENKNIAYLKHPLHSKCCHKHKNDGIDMKHAATDFATTQAQDVAE